MSMALLENRKGKAITAAAIDLCLKKLQLDYVDLVWDGMPGSDRYDYPWKFLSLYRGLRG